jgi:alpha-soluble NSF attachment protein
MDARGENLIHLFIRTANACYKDAADLHAELEEYPQAIARYEQVADASLASTLTRYSVKEYWFKAILCALAMGVSTLLFLCH